MRKISCFILYSQHNNAERIINANWIFSWSLLFQSEWRREQDEKLVCVKHVTVINWRNAFPLLFPLNAILVIIESNFQEMSNERLHSNKKYGLFFAFFFAARMRETRSEKRRICWESVFPSGILEGNCPVCTTSLIRYSAPCGNTFQKLHIIPKSRGGSDESWNLLPGCGCNQNMSTLNLIDWMGTKGNRKQEMKSLFLSKYKSLVPPVSRSSTNSEQLIDWIEEHYRPEFLNLYREWLLLSQEELSDIGSLSGHQVNRHILLHE